MLEKRWIGLLIMAVPILFFLPYLGNFAYPTSSPFSDLVISHYPNAVFFRMALETWGQVPLWSNTILSGYPFAANPLSGLWYPPGWLVLVLPLPLGFNVLVLSHLLWGGFGMSLLLEAEGRGRLPAAIGGLLFVMMPKLLAHFAAGHITMVYAVCWTPWLLWLQKRWFARKNRRMGAALATVWGLILLADVRWGALAGVFWLCYFLRGQLAEQARNYQHYSISSAVKDLSAFGLQAVGGVLLAAPLLLPLLEYSSLSTRALMMPDENLVFSLPPVNLLGVFAPQFSGNAEWVVYAGVLPFLMLIRVISNPELRRSQAFWICVIIGGLMVSLGAHLPLFVWLAELPGISLLRVPSRALFISSMGLAAVASAGIETLIHGGAQAAHGDRSANLVTTGLIALLLALSAGVYVTTGDIPAGFAWGGCVALIVTVGFLAVKKGKLETTLFFRMLIVFVWLDLLVVGSSFFDFRSQENVHSEGQYVVEFLAQQSGQFRVYSPSYSIPQHTAARYGLELADGVDPLQLVTYIQFMHHATGVPVDRYSVTLPPFATGHPTKDNAGYLPDTELLGLLNVRFLASAFPLASDGLELLEKTDSVYIYENHDVLPRAWVQTTKNLMSRDILSYPRINYWNANSIGISAQGPGVLVISQAVYPGWILHLDGERHASESVGGLLQAVTLPPGEHQVILSFIPVRVYSGLVLAVIALGVGLVIFWQGKVDDE